MVEIGLLLGFCLALLLLGWDVEFLGTWCCCFYLDYLDLGCLMLSFYLLFIWFGTCLLVVDCCCWVFEHFV